MSKRQNLPPHRHTSVVSAAALVISYDDSYNQPRVILSLKGSMGKHGTQAVYERHDIGRRLRRNSQRMLGEFESDLTHLDNGMRAPGVPVNIREESVRGLRRYEHLLASFIIEYSPVTAAWKIPDTLSSSCGRYTLTTKSSINEPMTSASSSSELIPATFLALETNDRYGWKRIRALNGFGLTSSRYWRCFREVKSRLMDVTVIPFCTPFSARVTSPGA